MILVDYSQVVISGFFKAIENAKDFEVDDDFIKHIILNIIRSINVKHRTKYGKMVICVDSRSTWRKDIYPYYKANRKKNREDSKVDWDKMFAIMNQIKSDLKEYFGYAVVEVEKAEADDVIATLAMVYSKHEEVLIVSSDKDFIQLQAYSENIKQYSYMAEGFIVDDDPKYYLYKHIMSGDTGDGIPNVLSDDDTFVVDGKRQKRLGDVKIKTWHSMPLKELFTTTEEISRYNRNKNLIDLKRSPDTLKLKILDTYNEEKEVKPPSIYTYLTKHRMINLLDKSRDFA